MSNGRITQILNLDWKFTRTDEPKAWYKGVDDSGWRTITLPHDWSVEEPFSPEHSSGTGYLPGGLGWYRKTFYLPEEDRGKRVSVTFDGVYNNSQVWCNSYYIGKRPYGYSAFTYDITDFAAFGDVGNVLCVKVHHKDIADSRWFTGSGIYRDVTLTLTDPIHIDPYGVFVTTPEVSNEQAAAKVNIHLSNETSENADIQVKVSIADESGRTISANHAFLSIPGGAAIETDQELMVRNPRLWSPENPYLYLVLTEVVRDGRVLDQVQTPIGFRWFTFDAQKGFFLNGFNVKLKGVCVHHDAGCLGAAVPAKVWGRKLETLKQMGCNAIRMSHNPPSAKLLDLCDQMGFLVMDEAFDEWEGVKNKWSVGHNVYPPKHFGYYEDFPQWGETDIKEMVRRDRNHPSIILWSIGNEIDYPNDPYCHPLFQSVTGNNDANKPAEERIYDPNRPNAERLVTLAKRLVGQVKECDTTRPVTAALALPELSNLTGLSATLDIVGYNYKEQLYADDHERYPGRVTFGSENSGSLEAWLAVEDNDYISGQFIWTGIDYMGEAQGWPVRVAQSGFLDLAGYPKTRYFYRKSLWCEEPVAYLAMHKKDDSPQEERHRRENGDPHWNWEPGDKLEVFCCTNCGEAELFINGNSLGSKKRIDAPRYILQWEAEFESGTLTVIAKNGDGTTIRSELHTASKAARIAMCVDSEELAADGQDIAHVEMEVLDAEGRLVYSADDYIRLTLDGPGEILGVENGDAQDLEPYSSKARKTYHGRLIAYVRSKTAAGRLVVKAEAAGLEPAQAVIRTK